MALHRQTAALKQQLEDHPQGHSSGSRHLPPPSRGQGSSPAASSEPPQLSPSPDQSNSTHICCVFFLKLHHRHFPPFEIRRTSPRGFSSKALAAPLASERRPRARPRIRPRPCSCLPPFRPRGCVGRNGPLVCSRPSLSLQKSLHGIYVILFDQKHTHKTTQHLTFT